MVSKAAPLSESHPDLVVHWMGNVKPADIRTPDDFGIKARLECWWWCGRTAHERFTAVPGEHRYGFGCPTCRAESRAEYERVMQLPVGEVPELVAAWRDERPFDGLRVVDLCGGVAGQNFGKTFSLRCANGHKLDTVVRRFVDVGCPWCRGNATRAHPHPPLSEADPELAATFHPTRNGDLTVDTVPENYREPLWWTSVQCCRYEWQETIAERTLGRRPQAGRGHYYCPRCESVWGSLAWLDPELAAEWHEENSLTPWHVKPYSGDVVAKWRCIANPEHEWEASVVDRSSGRLCPFCSTAGTSRVEQDFLAAAQSHDPDAAATRIGRWKVDVLVPSVRLVIEYDGVYWHRGKQEVDARKTYDLVQSGFLVARLRENDLGNLDLDDPHLRQLSFRPGFGRVDDVMAELVGWARERQPGKQLNTSP